jgi:Putative auto-transporter adhesin, head GIN domain
MKNLTLLTLALLIFCAVQAQNNNERALDSFRKIVVSPKIKLVLKKGEKESIRITALNVDATQLNIRVEGKKLLIYLDDARYLEKRERPGNHFHGSRKSIYHDASVTAYVTYKELKSIEVRGEERVECEDTIQTDKFKLKAYGTTDINLAGLQVRKFKTSLYGENRLRIASGKSMHQRYRLYGENVIESSGLESETIATNVYGEGRVSIKATGEVRLNAFGEPQIFVEGPAQLSKGLVIGRVGIRRY